jgi:hypothetical protein
VFKTIQVVLHAILSPIFGVRFEQIINIVGANGRTISVKFVWERGPNGVERLITAIPTSK